VLNAAEFRQFRSFIFRKVVQRHIWGVVGKCCEFCCKFRGKYISERIL